MFDVVYFFLCLTLLLQPTPIMALSMPNKSTNIHTRSIGSCDQHIVWQFLMHAAHEGDIEQVKANPLLQPYAQNFGNENGDSGIVATIIDDNKEDSICVGAAWVRFQPGELFASAHLKDMQNPDFQLIHQMPELAIACLPEYCGKGVGSTLLQKLLQKVQEGTEFPGVCLSCRADNAAFRLYERVGFTAVKGSELTNRAGGVSLTMMYRFKQ